MLLKDWGVQLAWVRGTYAEKQHCKEAKDCIVKDQGKVGDENRGK